MKKHKFNWVDGLVILLVVLLIAGAVYKFRGSNNVTSSLAPTRPVTYEVSVSNVRAGMVDAIREEDVLYDGDSGNAVGTIAKVEVSDTRVLMEQEDGTVLWGQREGRYDMVLTIDAQAVVNGDICMVNRIYQLNVGSTRSLYTRYASWTGRITDIQIP